MNNKGNIAFKFNFCNGRDEKTDFGFKRLCTKELIVYNIEKKKADWCSHAKCPCRQCYKGGISYEKLEVIWKEKGICGESRLLTEWTPSAEYTTTLDNWKGRTIKSAEHGGVCVLTAVKPNMDEKSRKIFGVFIIDEIYEGCKEECGYVKAHIDHRVELSVAETNDFNFWDFYENENSPNCRWGQGAFRYLYDEQSAQILKKLVEIKKGTIDGERTEVMLKQFCKSRGIDSSNITEPCGANKK